MILRRLYVYVVSLVSLVVAAAGLSFLGTAILLFLFHDASANDNRAALAGYTAMVVVALPVWLLHQWLANRRPSAETRASALRRLYLYLSSLGLAIGSASALAIAAGKLLTSVLEGARFDFLHASQALLVGLVLGVLSAYHHLLADRDRAAYGEDDFSATLRRWYWYVLLGVSLLMWLAAAHDFCHALWLRGLGSSPAAGEPAGTALVWLAIWGYHAWRLSCPPLSADDRRSVLRAVHGFLILTVCVVTAVVAANLILYYGVARAIGVTSPGGVSNPLVGLSDYLPMLLIYGGAWLLMRRRLAADAGAEEASHQAGVRRLYTNLAALVALGATAVGAGGLLATLSEQVLAPLLSVKAPDWKDPVSLTATLLAVGVSVWLFHWRPTPPQADRASLSRRLYLYLTLLASVLALLGSGIALIYTVFRIAFSQNPTLHDSQNLDFGRYTAVVLVAAAVGYYHFTVLRRDNAARPQALPEETHPPAPAAPPRLRVEVSGASDAELRRALAQLPPGATFSISKTEPGAVD